MGPTWALSAPDGPHIGPMNLAIRVHLYHFCVVTGVDICRDNRMIHCITNFGNTLCCWNVLQNSMHSTKQFMIYKSFLFVQVLVALSCKENMIATLNISFQVVFPGCRWQINDQSRLINPSFCTIYFTLSQQTIYLTDSRGLMKDSSPCWHVKAPIARRWRIGPNRARQRPSHMHVKRPIWNCVLMFIHFLWNAYNGTGKHIYIPKTDSLLTDVGLESTLMTCQDNRPHLAHWWLYAFGGEKSYKNQMKCLPFTAIAPRFNCCWLDLETAFDEAGNRYSLSKIIMDMK